MCREKCTSLRAGRRRSGGGYWLASLLCWLDNSDDTSIRSEVDAVERSLSPWMVQTLLSERNPCFAQDWVGMASEQTLIARQR
jgi:hypothetical protein